MTARGTSVLVQQLPRAEAEHVAVDARHPLEAPVGAGLADGLVHLVELAGDAADHAVGVLAALGVAGRLAPEGGDDPLGAAAARLHGEEHLQADSRPDERAPMIDLFG